MENLTRRKGDASESLVKTQLQQSTSNLNLETSNFSKLTVPIKPYKFKVVIGHKSVCHGKNSPLYKRGMPPPKGGILNIQI